MGCSVSYVPTQMASYVDNFWLQEVKLRFLRSFFAVGSKVDSLCCSN